jgi:hypothetical protein
MRGLNEDAKHAHFLRETGKKFLLSGVTGQGYFDLSIILSFVKQITEGSITTIYNFMLL